MELIGGVPSFTVFIVLETEGDGCDVRALAYDQFDEIVSRLRNTYYFYLDPR